MPVQVKYPLRTQVPALFTGSNGERPTKNPQERVMACPPKAEVTGSNPVGCTTPIRAFSNW